MIQNNRSKALKEEYSLLSELVKSNPNKSTNELAKIAGKNTWNMRRFLQTLQADGLIKLTVNGWIAL